MTDVRNSVGRSRAGKHCCNILIQRLPSFSRRTVTPSLEACGMQLPCATASAVTSLIDLHDQRACNATFRDLKSFGLPSYGVIVDVKQHINM